MRPNKSHDKFHWGLYKQVKLQVSVALTTFMISLEQQSLGMRLCCGESPRAAVQRILDQRWAETRRITLKSKFGPMLHQKHASPTKDLQRFAHQENVLGNEKDNAARTNIKN